MPAMYPMLLDVTDRQIVIVGGGSVAARKAAGLIEAGETKVRVVAREFRRDFPESVQARDRVIPVIESRRRRIGLCRHRFDGGQRLHRARREIARHFGMSCRFG